MAKLKVCGIEGCGKTAHARGWCGAHYERWRCHGDPLAGRTPDGAPLAFLLESLSIEKKDCVIWPFGGDGAGYGQVWIDGKKHNTHRLVCAKAHGEPPTPEHEAAHSCGNGHLGCINKRHLSWKTPAENQADRLTHGTDNRGEKNGVAKLTEADVLEIRRLRGAALPKSLAEQFGVSPKTISRIHSGENWAWLATRAAEIQLGRMR